MLYHPNQLSYSQFLTKNLRRTYGIPTVKAKVEDPYKAAEEGDVKCL